MKGSWRRALPLAAAIPLLGVVELLLAITFSHRAPTEPEWGAARSRVAELRKQADAIVIAPWWSEPYARKAFGDELLPLRDVARPDATRYKKLVEVSAVGQHLAEVSDWRVLSDEALGSSLRARVLENPQPVTLTTDFVDRIEEGRAEALHRFSNRDDVCTFRTNEPIVAPGLFGHPAMPARRFVCGNQPWLSVGVTVQDDLDFHARRCIWSHPPAGGSVVVRFPDTTLGSVIHGHMGIHATVEREKRGAPIELDVSVDGDVVGHARHEDGEGWALFVAPLGAHANEKNARVEFTFRTADANERHLCWEADSR
jgi:hypothetical protein